MTWLRLLGLLFLVAYSFSMGQIPPSGLNAFGKLAAGSFFVAAPVLYMLPTIEAGLAKHSNTGAIAALNVLLGWTVIGWVIAYVWSQKKPEPAATPVQWAPSPQAQPNANTKLCPFCAEPVQLAAIKCKHCGSDLSA